MSDQIKKTKIPLAGQKVRGSKTGQPIMVLFDLLGRRWAMGIIWNLSAQNLTFRQIQTKCDGLSPTVLNTRLKELRAANLIEKASHGYALTADGKRLFNMLEPLGEWSHQWTDRLAEQYSQ